MERHYKNVERYTKHLLATVVVIALLASCKTEYEQLLYPYNDIERFTISGYGDIDSLDAVIENENIVVYWNPDTERPEEIRPRIAVSEGASVHPASGEAVSFSENTTYTVTAADGMKKEYKLKPVFNLPIPSIYSAPSGLRWAETVSFVIEGQYFLSTGDAKDIKIYLQRDRDGFEFDIPFDTASVISTKITAQLPQFTSELDTGLHHLYVKIGDFESDYTDITLFQPAIDEMVSSVDFDHIGNISFGDVLEFKMNIKDEWKEAYARYPVDQITSLRLTLQQIVPGSVINARSRSIDTSALTINDDGIIRIKMAEEFLSEYKNHRFSRFSITYGGDNYTESFTYDIPSNMKNNVLENILEETQYATFSFSHGGQQIKPGEEMTIDYTFLTEEYETLYGGRIRKVSFGLKDPQTGVYSVYEVTATLAGNRITFTIPETATEVVNKDVVMIGFTTLAVGSSALLYVQPRKQLENTSIVN